MGLFKSAKRAVKKITKPVAKVLNKVVPNELKPFLPYAAAVAPYLLPAGTAGAGLLGTMKGRAFLTGGLNLASQLAQEGNEEGDFSALSLGLAGLQGALTAPGAAETLRGMQVADTYNPELAQLGKPELVGEPLSFLDKARNVGLGALEKGATFAEGITETLQDPFSASLGEFGKAAVVPFSQGSMDLGMATARKALRDYELELDAFNAQVGADQAASDADRRAAIIASMTRADFTQDVIDETLGQLGLKDGGRVGFDNGGSITEGIKAAYGKGMDKSIPKMKKDEDLTRDEIARIKMAVFEVLDQTAGGDKSTLSGGFIDNFGDALEQIVRPDLSAYIKDYVQGTGIFSENFIVGGKEDLLTKAEGGIARLGFDNGGDVSFGGITEAVKNVAKEPKKFLVDKLEVTVQPGQSEKMAIINAMFNDVDDIMPEDRKAEFYRLYLPQLRDSGEISQNDYNSLIKELNLIELDKDYKVTKDPKLIKFIDKLQPAAEGIDNLLKKVGIDVDKMRTKPNIRKAKGGLASLKDGGIMDLGGKEMDMRTGGFIPIGAKERADDVPARLSKNEFVMTADAVRAAGGGSVNKGAKRMYDLMHNLEARA